MTLPSNEPTPGCQLCDEDAACGYCYADRLSLVHRREARAKRGITEFAKSQNLELARTIMASALAECARNGITVKVLEDHRCWSISASDLAFALTSEEEPDEAERQASASYRLVMIRSYEKNYWTHDGGWSTYVGEAKEFEGLKAAGEARKQAANRSAVSRKKIEYEEVE